MASSSSSVPPYSVFISHAGTDKHTIAIPLRAKLMSNNISAFVDEADMEPGTEAEQAMIHAIETVDIAVVVLSPEFVARKWPMKELMCFLRRREETREGSRCVPVIIPFFYRLSVSDLYDEPRFDRVDEDGKSIYRASRFFDRMDNGEPEAQVGEIKAALHKVHGIMGVRNDDGASNESRDEMELRREKLLDILSEKIRNAVLNVTGQTKAKVRKEEQSETFRAHFDDTRVMKKLVFSFCKVDESGYANTIEARVLENLADESTDVNRVITIRGIGGVGKTCLLRALCSLSKVKTRFRDGVYRISMGVDCTLRKLTEELSNAVEKSGGLKTANKMRAEKNFLKMMGMFRSWFDGRQCMFAVDDVWKTGDITFAIISQMIGVHESGRNSKVLLTTRSAEVASMADTSIAMEPRVPLGSESREILVRHSGIKPAENESANRNVIDVILTRCGGLPLFLAAAGKSVKSLSFRRGHEGFAAYLVYAENLEANMQRLLDTDVDEYERLSARLTTSVEVVEERKSALTFRVRLGMGAMHRRLAVMERQSRVPMTMLRWLWEVKNEREAAVLAKEFEQVGLADVEFEKRGSRYVEMLRLHDSIYDFALTETETHGEEKLGHEKLLQGYGLELKWMNHCREWWSTWLESDDYIHKSVCRHLAGCGRYRELIELLLCPEWACRVVMVAGVSSLMQDLSLGIRVLQNLHEEGTDIFSDSVSRLFQPPFQTHLQSKEALELVLEAVKLSYGFLYVNPAEAWFQLHGRLMASTQTLNAMTAHPSLRGTLAKRLSGWWKGSKASVNRIETYVQRLGEGGSKPRVRSIDSLAVAAGSLNTLLVGLNSSVLCMAVMKDQKRVVCGCANGRIISVNLIRGEVETAWHAHRGGILSTAIARDGKLILSGSFDKTVKVWDFESCRCVTTFEGHTGHVYCVAVLPDGTRAVSGSGDGTIQVWHIDTGRIVSQTLRGHTGEVFCLAVFPDGDLVVTGGNDKTLRVWDITNGAEIGPAFVGHAGPVISVAVTMDGKRIVTASWDSIVKIWCTETHLQIGEFIGGRQDFSNPVNVSTNGMRILSGSADGTILVWDAENGREACHPLVGHSSSVTGVSFLQDCNSILSCSKDGTVRVWDLHRKSGARVLDRHASSVTRVSFTPEGTRAVSESDDGTVRIWDARSGRQVSEPLRVPEASLVESSEAPEDLSNRLMFASDRAYVSLSRGHLFVWDLESRKLMRTFAEFFSTIVCITMTPSGRQAVTGSRFGTIRVWDLTATDGNPFTLADHLSPVERVFVSDDGLRVVSVDWGGNISMWDLETRQRLRQLFKSNSALQSRRWVMDAIGEVTSQDDAGLLIPLQGYRIMHCHENERQVLATMDSRVRAWELSPDKGTICLGLENGCVVFLRLEL